MPELVVGGLVVSRVGQVRD